MKVDELENDSRLRAEKVEDRTGQDRTGHALPQTLVPWNGQTERGSFAWAGIACAAGPLVGFSKLYLLQLPR